MRPELRRAAVGRAGIVFPSFPERTIEERHPAKPLLDQPKQRDPFLSINDRLVIALVEPAHLGVLVVVGPEPVFHPEAEGRFDLPELGALESGSAFEAGTEIEEI